MKKFISILLCVLLLPLNFAFFAQAEEEDTQLIRILKDDFTGTAGSTVSGWLLPEASNNAKYVYVADPADKSNSVLRMRRTAKGGRTKMRRDIGSLGTGNYFDKDMVITYRAYDYDGKNELQLILRQYNPESLSDTEGHQILTVPLYKSDIGHDKKTWLDVRIEISMSGTYTMTVKDGEKIIKTKSDTFSFYDTTGGVADGIKGFWQVDFESHSNLVGTWYIDDFAIWTQEKTAMDDATGLQEILSEDFSGEIGVEREGWTIDNITDNARYVVAEDPKNPDERVLKLNRVVKGSGNRVKMYTYLGKGYDDYISGNMLITFRAYDEDGTGRLNVNLRDTDVDEEGPVFLSCDLEKKIYPDITTGVWYDCFIELKNNGVDPQTFSMWMIGDGGKVVIAKNQPVYTAVSGACRLDLEENYDRLGDWYIDDLKVYVDCREELRAAAQELTFSDIANGNQQDNVVENLAMQSEINYNGTNYPVIWESSDENFVLPNGSVTRRSFTQDVTLTAKVCMPDNLNAYVENIFEIKVTAVENSQDETILSEYAQFYLKEELFSKEESTAITKNLSGLPTEGANGIAIEWQSNSDAIAPDGTVTRPEYGEGDAEVTLEAILTLNGLTETATLNYIVLQKPDPYIDINATLEQLTYEYLTSEDSSAITSDITLPTKGAGAATISWESQHSAISDSGKVTRGDSEVMGKLIATISNPPAAESKEFIFNVYPCVEKILEVDMGDLNFDSTPSISESFDLPIVGETYGTQFVWESDSNYLVIDGSRAIVSRPLFTTGDITVNLSLTATYGGEEYLFNYPVKILCQGTDEEVVDYVISKLGFSQISGEDEAAITQNLALVTELNGVEISWQTSDDTVVAKNGEVLRPLPGEEPEEVTLTATFVRGDIEKTETYTFTVIPFSDNNEVLTAAKNALIFSVISDEAIDAVTEDLTLPTTWKYGTEIEWISESENIVISGKTGEVNRPDWGKTVALAQLKAIISYESVSVIKEFDIEILENNYMEVVQDVWSEDFETWTPDNMYKTTGAYWVEPGETEAEVSLATDPTDDNNNVLKVDRTVKNAGIGYVYACSEAERGGIVYMRVKFFLEPGGHFQANGRSTTCDQAPVSISGSGIVAGKYTINDYKAKENAWNEVELVVNVPKERYHIYLNGELCTENGTIADDKGMIIDTTDGLPYHYYGQGREAFMHSFRMHFSSGKAFLIDDLSIKNKILYTDAQLNLAEAWEQEFLAKNNINSITSTLVFPAVWADGVRVFYYSEDSSVLDTAGMIQLPVGEADVVFKVGFSDGFSEFIKTYKLHVIKSEKVTLTDEEAVRADFEAAVNTIKESGLLTNLKNNLNIPSSGENGSTITVVSSDTSILTNDGAITRGTSDKSVTLTVTAAKNGITKQEVFDIIVAKIVAQSSTTSSSGGGGGGIKVTYGEQSKGDTGIDITQPDNENKDKAKFKDLTDEHWAYSELMYMAENGIMNGTGDGNIQPERTILREEFIKMLVLSLGLDLTEEEAQFTDVSPNAWYAPYIQTAKKAGLVNGYEDGKVGIGEEISRQDMAVMIFRAAEIAESGADNLFGDDDVISDYAKSAIYTLKDIGVVNGKDNGNFAPGATATRAETACMLYRAIKKDLFK